MDIYHTGKEDLNDDHKTINERLLEVAIPEESDENPNITLESCLEAYFNNRIEVKRHLYRLSAVQNLKSEPKNETVHIEAAEISSQPSSPVTERSENRLNSARPLSAHTRNNSIFSERYEDLDKGPDAVSEVDILARGRPRKGSLRKEVLMPAWQFFRLIRKCIDATFSRCAKSSIKLGILKMHRRRTIRLLHISHLKDQFWAYA